MLMILFYYGLREDLICINIVSFMGLIFGLLCGFVMGLGCLGGYGRIASFSGLVMGWSRGFLIGGGLLIFWGNLIGGNWS